jgi:UDP-2,4-diacetamido-2,4,6-trideoxy-beta-L-altropyranose hydrolase
MFVRVAVQEDCHDIFKWRNDKHSVKMFRNPEPVAIEEHERWFNKILLKHTNKYLFICLNQKNEKIGVVRFDIKNNDAEISINIAPEMRGKGLGTDCLTETIIYSKKYLPNVALLIAKIKNINKASQKVFLSAGFNLIDEVDDYLIYSRKFS